MTANQPPSSASQHAAPYGVMFMYWGRRGAMSQFMLELGRAALADPTLKPVLCISRQNELFSAFCQFGPALLPVDTFQSHLGAAAQAWRTIPLRRRLAAYICEHRIAAVIETMPHVWTPLVAPAIRRAGARFVTTIHDADAHAGDPTGLVHGWGLRAVHHADLVVTLSDTIAGRLARGGRVPHDRLRTLFHPDLCYGPQSAVPLPPAPGEPFRVLFLGRILPYKGLPLLLDAVDLVRSRGIPLQLGVFGEGNLDALAPRLDAIGAEVVNRWLTEDEIGAVTRRYHAVVLAHIEASQSGVAAAAHGAGLPVVATPVGGLPEQIEDRVNGLLAARADAPALADAMATLATSPGLYGSIVASIAEAAAGRSMARFVTEITALARTSQRLSERT